MTSCEDTLDMPSYTKDDTDFAFRDEYNADLFVKGIYSGFLHEEIYRVSNTGETTTTESPDGITASGGKWGMSNYNYQPNTPIVFDRIYSEGYKRIERCNLAIYRLRGMEQTDKVKALIGEAVTLRAYIYFNLIRFFGDVPFQTEPLELLNPEDEDVKYPTRTSRDVIYDYIINDMVETIDDMPWQSQAGWTERLTRNSAKGILARICLHAAGWSLRWNLETNDPSTMKMALRPDAERIEEIYKIADNALYDVIQKNENYLIQADSEKSGFFRLFYYFTHREFGVSDPEMMWSLANLGSSVNTKYGIDVGSTGATSATIFGQRKAMQLRLPTYYLSFDPKDTRRDVTCGNYTIGNTTTSAATSEFVCIGTTYSSVTPGKVRMQWAVEPDPSGVAKRNVNIPMLRYSDILLMYAETQNHLNHGPNQAAREALQKVRDRAGVGHLAIPSGEQEFLEALLQERKWEFADEFLVRTDMVRMNLVTKEIEQAKADLRALSKREGKYANVAEYRLYKYTNDENTYGSPFLTVEYIDITDPAEVAAISKVPTAASQYEAFQTQLQAIAKAHGRDDKAKWYPCNMFENFTKVYNWNGRKLVGIQPNSMGIEYGTNAMAGMPTGYKNNGNKYPKWIDGDVSIYYWFKSNHSELSPFATNATGKPLVDNPRLTQLPGYPGYTAPAE